MLRARVAAVGCAGVAFAPAAAVGAVVLEAPASAVAPSRGAGVVDASSGAVAQGTSQDVSVGAAEGPDGATVRGPADQGGATVRGAADRDGAAVRGAAADGDAPPAARLPAVEVTSARRVRHDGYVGFGLGLGGGNLRQAGAGSLATTFVLRAGGRWTDRVALGGLVVTSFGGGGKQAVVGFSNLLVEALFFPIKDRGLGLAAGLGVSSAWVRVPATDGSRIDKSTRVGGAVGLGVGYDFWLARRFNLGLWLRADGSVGGFGVRAAGTFGLGFAWY